MTNEQIVAEVREVAEAMTGMQPKGVVIVKVPPFNFMDIKMTRGVHRFRIPGEIFTTTGGPEEALRICLRERVVKIFRESFPDQIKRKYKKNKIWSENEQIKAFNFITWLKTRGYILGGIMSEGQFTSVARGGKIQSLMDAYVAYMSEGDEETEKLINKPRNPQIYDGDTAAASGREGIELE